MRRVARPHPLEEHERIGVAEEVRVVHRVDDASLREDPPVRVANPPLHLRKVLDSERFDPGIAKHDEAGLEVLGQGLSGHRMVHQPVRQVDLSDRRAGPVDHRRRQDAPDLQLLAKADEQGVHSGGIDVGQLGQVADAHHHRSLRVAAADLEIAAERRREAEPERLDDRIDPVRDLAAIEAIDRRLEAVERAGLIRDRDDFDAPVGGLVAIAGVDAQDELGSRRDGLGHLDRVEAVNRDPEADVAQGLDGIADAGPGAPGVAAQIDHVGTVSRELLGLGDQLDPGELRRMIDLRQDLDVIGPIPLPVAHRPGRNGGAGREGPPGPVPRGYPGPPPARE